MYCRHCSCVLSYVAKWPGVGVAAKRMGITLKSIEFDVQGTYDPTALVKGSSPPPSHFSVYFTMWIKWSDTTIGGHYDGYCRYYCIQRAGGEADGKIGDIIIGYYLLVWSTFMLGFTTLTIAQGGGGGCMPSFQSIPCGQSPCQVTHHAAESRWVGWFPLLVQSRIISSNML
jgi:hypothetical protein